MLKLLEQRAEYLKVWKMDKANKVTNKLTDTKNSNFDHITRPNRIFITFEHEKGRLNALEKKEIKIEDEKLEINETLQPSNIIWENTEIDGKQRFRRATAVVLFMLTVSLVLFALFIHVVNMQKDLSYIRNPPGIECSTVISE